MICKELSKHFSHSAIVWKHFVRTHHGPCGMIISSFDSVAGRWAWYLYDFGFVFDCPCTLYSVHQNIADHPAMSIRPLPIADRVDDIESSKNPTRAKKRNHVRNSILSLLGGLRINAIEHTSELFFLQKAFLPNQCSNIPNIPPNNKFHLSIFPKPTQSYSFSLFL